MRPACQHKHAELQAQGLVDDVRYTRSAVTRGGHGLVKAQSRLCAPHKSGHSCIWNRINADGVTQRRHNLRGTGSEPHQAAAPSQSSTAVQDETTPQTTSRRGEGCCGANAAARVKVRQIINTRTEQASEPDLISAACVHAPDPSWGRVPGASTVDRPLADIERPQAAPACRPPVGRT
jgi:hypothetical protein